MKSKFDLIYEHIMGPIITEAWDRWSIEQILTATKAITHNFNVEWVKGVTGGKILEELKTYVHTKGSERVNRKRRNGSRFI